MSFPEVSNHADSVERDPQARRPAVNVRDLTFQYGDQVALDGISFQVPEGCLFGLLGPNGSGKTTLFRLLATLLPVQGGLVQMLGYDLRTAAQQIRQLLGMTFQSPALDVRLTVQENLDCHGALYGLRRNHIRESSKELLTDLGLLSMQSKKVETLSGGQKRRVELAKGLLQQPRILLLDEPSTGLDPVARRQFRDLLNRHRSHMTVILSTHLMEEAAECDQLVLLDQGNIVAEGSPAELQRSVPDERLSLKLKSACPDHVQKNENRIQQLLNCEGHWFGRKLVFRLPDAANALQLVMSQMRDEIETAEVAQATLEDVFAYRTGRSLEESDAEPSPPSKGRST